MGEGGKRKRGVRGGERDGKGERNRDYGRGWNKLREKERGGEGKE